MSAPTPIVEVYSEKAKSTGRLVFVYNDNGIGFVSRFVIDREVEAVQDFMALRNNNVTAMEIDIFLGTIRLKNPIQKKIKIIKDIIKEFCCAV